MSQTKVFSVAAATSAILFLLSGCAVDQQREVERYRQILDAQVPPPPAPATAPTPQETLTLRQAMAMANQSSEDLGLRGEDYVQSLIDKNRIVAQFLPTVSFQPSFTIGQRPAGPAPGGAPVSGITTGFRTSGDLVHKTEAPVVGSINVFRGFGDVADLKAAESIIAQRKDLLLDLQATILLNVAQTYYQVLRSEQAVVVLNHSLELQQARLNDVEQQLRNGLATRLSVAQTRAQLDSTQVLLLQAQSDVRNGRSTLAHLIGIPSVGSPLLDAAIVPERIDDEASFERQAIEARQDLLAAREGLRAARHSVDAAIAEYYPSVTLDVTGFLYREFFSDASKWNAILRANLPIFSAGLIEADVREAWSRLRQAALQESATRRQALNDVQIAYENLSTSVQRVRELEDEVKAAQEAYDQSRGALGAGLATNLDVIAAQDQLLNSQLQLTGATFDRTVFYLDLLRSTGRLPQVMFATAR